MRITYTPFHIPTRSIGQDTAATMALFQALALPKLTIIQKIKRLFK